VTVGIVTDSAASLSEELADRHQVTVVPMQLTIGSESYPDDQVTLEEVVARLGEGITTSGPSPGAFAEAIEARRGPDGVLVLTVSERMSSTYRAARLAAQRAGAGVAVLDTNTAVGAEGLVVLAAAAAAAEGLPLPAVKERAHAAARRVRLVAAVESLDQLTRSGRLPELAARAGRRLGVRPLFEYRGGSIHPLLPALSREAALDQVLRQWRRSKIQGAALHVAALHALNPAGADRLLEAVRAEAEPATCFVGTFGPVMVAHTGPGVTGLAWWWAPPDAQVAGGR
jgi:DegV family protein with EDD domain